MTNRDPHTTNFTSKVVDFYDCLKDYYSISDKNKLVLDQKKPDIDLVCFYELHQLREHARDTKGLNYNDLVKLQPKEEKAFLSKMSAI